MKVRSDSEYSLFLREWRVKANAHTQDRAKTEGGVSPYQSDGCQKWLYVTASRMRSQQCANLSLTVPYTRHDDVTQWGFVCLTSLHTVMKYEWPDISAVSLSYDLGLTITNSRQRYDQVFVQPWSLSNSWRGHYWEIKSDGAVI